MRRNKYSQLATSTANLGRNMAQEKACHKTLESNKENYMARMALSIDKTKQLLNKD